MSKDLLLEIGTEEIPAGQILNAAKQLEDNAAILLNEKGIRFKAAETFATPRRLGIFLFEVEEKQKEQTIEVIGPPKIIAYDAFNNPTAAAVGFAKNNNITLSELKIKVLPKGEYICAVKKDKGEKTEKLLPDLLKQLIGSIIWTKTMRWQGDFRFIRPIRSVLALFGRKVLKFKIADLTSGNLSYGHRLLMYKPIIVKDIRKFKTQMKKAFVVVNYQKRRKMVLNEITKVARVTGGKPLLEENLVEEVTNLVEYPTAILGKFDAKYLNLPASVLIEVMVKNQKYFPIIKQDMQACLARKLYTKVPFGDKQDKLLPYFIYIRNGTKLYNNIVKDGNERVLRARFEDAEFFFNEDKKIPLENRVIKLKTVVFKEGLGSLYDKIKRLNLLFDKTLLMFKFADKNIVERAIYLCKADLLTDMVKEFSGLQGVMGKEYALIDGEPEEVATAILEHYMPVSAGGKLPDTNAGIALSILDKIDTIVGCFSIGLIPTGSQDPYGLRRDTIGIIDIVLKRKLNLEIKDIINASLETYEGVIKADKEKVLKELLQFFKGRIETLLLDEGIRYDVVNAVLNASYSNVLQTYERAKALDELTSRKDFNKIIKTFLRVINILPTSSMALSNGVNIEVLKEEAEKELFTSVKANESVFLANIDSKDYKQAFEVLVKFSPYIDKFFDEVLVMDENENIRNNRLALLGLINSMFLRIADFSKIPKIRH